MPPPSSPPPDFQHYLREQARTVMRSFLEGVMREELDALIGVGWGEHSPQRCDYYQLGEHIYPGPAFRQVEQSKLYSNSPLWG